MKKFMAYLFGATAIAAAAASALPTYGNFTAFAAENQLVSGCKSAYLCDYDSGECIYKYNETAHMPIASVCKVMTLTLCFDAMEEGKLSTQDDIVVSDRAAGMGGSQVFLESGNSYSADQLIKSIIVCSANDSCVALAEKLCGSEEVFVARMNQKAKELGCANTLFSNCTGLPKEPQYSCARDVAVMYSNLIGHGEYFDYSRIWLEDFVHPDDRVTSMTNTNKLLRKYKLCDGGKTGYTGEAGFCLASTAKSDNLRLVSVVLGGDSSDSRFDSAVKLFDYGFANYVNKLVLSQNSNIAERATVKGGKREFVSVCPARSAYVFSERSANPDVKQNLVLDELKAPVAKGDRVGFAEIYKDGVKCDTVELVAAEDVPKAGFGDNLRKVAGDWAL